MIKMKWKVVLKSYGCRLSATELFRMLLFVSGTKYLATSRLTCTFPASFLQSSEDIFSAVLFLTFCSACEVTWTIIGHINRFLLISVYKNCYKNGVTGTARAAIMQIHASRFPGRILLCISFSSASAFAWILIALYVICWTRQLSGACS